MVADAIGDDQSILEWCHRHCQGPYRWASEFRVEPNNAYGLGYDQLIVAFRDEADAVLFRLTWC